MFYEQINYQDTPYRVTPLEYSDLIKWITNRKEGLPAYVKVNMVSQESEVVELKEGRQTKMTVSLTAFYLVLT